MQTTDVLARWRRPAEWRQPGRVALVNVEAVDAEDPMHAALSAADLDLRPLPLHDESGEVSTEVADCDVAISGGVQLDPDFFAALRSTRLLLRPYVGYDDIDVDAATANGVLVANVPDAITEDVANQAMTLILAANRELLRLDSFVRTGGWARTGQRKPDEMVIHRPCSQTLGLVGVGRTGRETARRAAVFGYRLVGSDPNVPDADMRELGIEPRELDDLLRESDVVSLHVLLNHQTRHLVDSSKLALMKPTAWLVNTSRGPVVDQEALFEALREERIGGAALDVLEGEPLTPDSPLVELDNVILSPHVAGYSEEGHRRLRERAAEIALQVAGAGLPERQCVINRDLYDELAALPELAEVPKA
jgi:phosphoglycerate dehydrogenase-like enzyme